jgi:hypothetical protein
MAKEKVYVELTNGEKCATTKAGWNAEDIDKKGIPVLAEGWAEGKGVHFGLSLGYMKAIAEQLPDYVLGFYKAGNREVPVLDSTKLVNDIKQDWATHKELKVEVIKLARSKAKAVAALEEVKNNPEVMEILKTTNPALYAQLTGQAPQ